MLAMCACDSSKTENESETKAPTTSSESASESTTEPGGSSESETTTETDAAPTRATYKVTYKDYSTSSAGVPIVGAQVQLCNGDLCLPPMWTDENGVAEFKNVMIADYTITITVDGESFNAEFPEGSYEVELGRTVEAD